MTDKTSDAPAGPGTTAMRLLIPIDATERSRWGVRYALRQHQVCLGAREHRAVTRFQPIRQRPHGDDGRNANGNPQDGEESARPAAGQVLEDHASPPVDSSTQPWIKISTVSVARRSQSSFTTGSPSTWSR